VFAALGLIGLFPSGRVEHGRERGVLLLVGVQAALLPVVIALTSRVLTPAGVFPGDWPPMASPWYVERLAPLAPAATQLFDSFPLWVVAGLGLLALRYRQATPPHARQIRWLLVGGAAAFVTGWAVAYVFLWLGLDAPAFAVLITWPLTVALVLGSLLVALFYEGVFGIDRPARRRLVYWLLRTLITVVHAAVAAGLGLLASQVVPVGAAVLLAVVAAIAFLPARRRLEALADRWVFGARLDGYDLLGRFGDSLERSPGPARVLLELAQTVRRGLDLTWARVLLEPDTTNAASVGASDDGSALVAAAGVETTEPTRPALIVPIRHGGTELGRIECGPRRDGNPLLEEDRCLLGYLAGQAAAAVHNLYLTAELSARLRVIQQQAAQLAASRERVVAGQDAERRRIQRDLHDGVQQEVVALTAKLSLARQKLGRGDPHGEQLLSEVHHDLGVLQHDLREFAYAIHPPVLTDRGLLEAVQAQAARLPVAMMIRADPALRTVRYPPQIEATAWYALAEALSNVVKHANATQVEVSLRQPSDRLMLTVCDDGCGFDPADGHGLGLAGLADRLDILGGTLRIDSTAGHGTTLRMEIPLNHRENADA
jgi:signal transduction histidine kinase